MVWCKAPFLLASLAGLRKYFSFAIVNAINEEKFEKEKRIELRWYIVQHMLLKRNEFLTAWPSLGFLHLNPCLF